MQLNSIIISVIMACFLSAIAEGLQCQTGLKFSLNAGGNTVKSDFSSSTCPAQADRCASVTVEVTVPGIDAVPLAVGQCSSRAVCDQDVCAQITAQLEQNPTFATGQISNCRASCCSTDNCNSAMNISYSVGMVAFLALTTILALLLN